MNKRVGRPVKPAPEAGRVALSLRVTAPMKTMLEEEAAKNGRSLSQEAEMRLERSFDIPKVAQSFANEIALALKREWPKLELEGGNIDQLNVELKFPPKKKGKPRAR